MLQVQLWLRISIFCCLFVVCLSIPVMSGMILQIGPESLVGRLLLFVLTILFVSLSVIYSRLDSKR